MANVLSYSTLYERKQRFYASVSLIIYCHFFTVRNTRSPTLTLQNMHRRAEAYQITQLLYRNIFSHIFLAFYALHFFLPKQKEKDKYSYKGQTDSLSKPCYSYHAITKTFLALQCRHQLHVCPNKNNS